ncbi:efflux RND transporter periplasmic adaptor subunit [Indioceanicola profundi]|uniref:efflux RND transporter periplasmic adaptor subunit n=1 Tax=Indioceanicola profundi TaxID=2220096 RepID=UPI000E6A9578|nr:HlyD family efflux transporter periplasmic adaptor subunit [Indioceanicola profundi]
MNQPMQMRDRQLMAMSALIQLEKRVRAAATPDELAFLMVNDTHMMVAYRQAALWRADEQRLQALSGLAVPDRDAPFTHWITRLFRTRADGEAGRRIHPLSAAVMETEEDGETWKEHLPPHGLWLPLSRPDGTLQGVLLLARDEPWADHERSLLELVADAYAHAWAALVRRQARRSVFTRKRRLLAGAAVAVVLAMLIPVRQSALAPAEVVARDPVLIRAPIQGVVEEIKVRPNQSVAAGELLATMDGREMSSRLDVARQQLAVADAELRQAQQSAVFDEKSRAQMAVLQGRREQHAAEVAYIQQLLERIRLTAPRDGVAIFDDPGDWAGRPVSLGERIMMVADPKDAELEIHLPVADAITLESGAEILLFLNIDASAPVPAVLERAGYRAAQTPDGIMAYRLRARFERADERLRVGLKGTAKVYGERTILFLYLMRRPLAAMRLWLGL